MHERMYMCKQDQMAPQDHQPQLVPLHPACSLSRQVEDIVELEADSDSTRPAFAIGVDHKARQVGHTGGGRPNWSWQLGRFGLEQASIANGVARCSRLSSSWFYCASN